MTNTQVRALCVKAVAQALGVSLTSRSSERQNQAPRRRRAGRSMRRGRASSSRPTRAQG